MQTLQRFIPLLYDIMTVVVFLYMISSCARRGFVRTVVALAGYAASIVVAGACAKPLARGVFEGAVRPKVVEMITQKLSQAQGELLPESLVPLVDEFPEAVFDLVGLDKEQMVDALQELVSGGGAKAAAEITDAIVAPLVLSVLQLFFFLLIFAVVSFLVRHMLGLFGGVNRLPLVGPVNQVLGALVGVLQAALTLYVAAVSIRLLMTLFGGSLTIGGVDFASSTVFRQTILFKAFMDFNPLNMLLALHFSASGGDAGHRYQLAGDLFV